MSNTKRNALGQFAPKHGLKKHPLYRKWCAMRERCNNPHNKRYERYGGRGIKVCEEWDDFSKFYEWSVQNGWSAEMTIDRIDNDKDYAPDNCRYVPTSIQNRNYSRNHNITYNGETHCLKEWEEITGINRATLLYRIRCGKPLEEIFSKKDGRTTRWKRAYLNG